MNSSNSDPAAFYTKLLSDTSHQDLESNSSELKDSNVYPSDDAIYKRVKNSSESLHSIIKRYLDDRSDLHQLVEQIDQEGFLAMNAVRQRNNEYLVNSNAINLLETIVYTDGNRPTFLIRNGTVDYDSAPDGYWKNLLIANADQINVAIACVGRINLSKEHIGTGFLIHKDLILTNRHVMQQLANEISPNQWLLKVEAVIDFGCEYRGISSINPRRIIEVIYCGDHKIDELTANHQLLDLAVLRLEDVPIEQTPRIILSLNPSTDWTNPLLETKIYTIGYPADPGIPGLIQYGSILEKLFHSLFGYKRIAPGKVVKSAVINAEWGTGHDTTTLGGNSGSLIVQVGNETSASGLHYGGKSKPPRENWGHILSKTLSTPIQSLNKTLQALLIEKGVKFINNNN